MRQILVVTALLALLVGSAVVIVGRSSLFAVPEGSLRAATDVQAAQGGGLLAPGRAKANAARTTETLDLMRQLSQSAAKLDLGDKDPAAKLSSPAAGPVAAGGPPSGGLAAGANPGSGSGDDSAGMAAGLSPDGAGEPGAPADRTKSAAVQPAPSASTAIDRYAAAAAGGDVNAAYRLGVAYRDGSGVSADPAASARWLLAAAQGGHAQAQIAVAEMYASGSGVSRDLAAAYMWFDRAAAGASAAFARDYAAKQRDRIAASMSEAELSRARQMAGQ
jgi:hypothetical protein